MSARGAVGRYGEKVAARHLQEAGIEILHRNWRYSRAGFRGELDIVARDGDALVAVEVKTRRTLIAGSGAEAVTPDKLSRLRRLLLAWLQEHPADHPASLRIDVMDVLVASRGPAQVRHLRAVG